MTCFFLWVRGGLDYTLPSKPGKYYSSSRMLAPNAAASESGHCHADSRRVPRSCMHSADAPFMGPAVWTTEQTLTSWLRPDKFILSRAAANSTPSILPLRSLSISAKSSLARVPPFSAMYLGTRVRTRRKVFIQTHRGYRRGCLLHSRSKHKQNLRARAWVGTQTMRRIRCTSFFMVLMQCCAGWE